MMSDQETVHVTNQDAEYKRGYELALAYAWHRFNSYDSQSGLLKQRYARIRYYIILASLLTTILSVLSVVETSERLWRLGFVTIGLILFILSLRMITSYKDTRWVTDATIARWNNLLTWLRGGQPPQEPAAPAAAVAETEEARAAREKSRKRRGQIERTIRNALLFLIAVVFFTVAAAFWIFSNGAADIAAYKGEGVLGGPVRLLMIMLLIALPLLSSGLLDFGARFESRRNWVGFRLGAEKIRRSIYILRVRNYYEELTAADLKLLNDTVKEARTALIDLGVTAPMLSDDFDPDKDPVKPNWVYVPADDGYSEMSIEDYFKLRLTPQLNWYRSRIRRDYVRSRYWRGFILLFGGLGALLTALDLSEFAAITAACVSAIVTWLALMSHEQNYRVYSSTLSRLEEEAVDYKVIENTATPEDRLKFVLSAEQVLASELDDWSQGVLQAQDVIEDNLGKMTKEQSGEVRFQPGQSMRLEADRQAAVAAPLSPEKILNALPEMTPAPVVAPVVEPAPDGGAGEVAPEPPAEEAGGRRRR